MSDVTQYVNPARRSAGRPRAQSDADDTRGDLARVAGGKLLNADDTDEDDVLQMTPAQQQAHWIAELDSAHKWMKDAKFYERAEKCERKYIDDRDTDYNNRRVNYFWANIQVILAAIYQRLPKAEVDRRFKDYSDQVGRVAGEMLERILNNDIEREYDDTNAALRDATQDRFVVGMGQVWNSYKPEFEQVPEQPAVDPTTGGPLLDPATGAPIIVPAYPKLVNEEACTEYVRWEDFRFSPCRRWRDNRWVARRCYWTRRDALDEGIDEEVVEQLPFASTRNATRGGSRDGMEDPVKKATRQKTVEVWEIWDRDSKWAFWVVKNDGVSEPIKAVEDPLRLTGFFPCPAPCMATTTTKSMIPRADYVMAQDLYAQLDDITERIANLKDAVKANFVYDQAFKELARIFQGGYENAGIPVEKWAQFAEKNGMKGSIDFVPIDMYVNALGVLRNEEKELLSKLYEILGISDIMRGTTVASETATAQQLKVQYGGARLAYLQASVARFVADTMRLRAEIIGVHFHPETIMARSLINQTQDAQYADAAMRLIKGPTLLRDYAVIVSSDSLAAPDWQDEKDGRMEYVNTVGLFLQQAGQMAQAMPSAVPGLLDILKWLSAAFKSGKTVESTIDQMAQTISQPPQPPQPPQPGTKEAADVAATQAEAALKGAQAEKAKADTGGKALENVQRMSHLVHAHSQGAQAEPLPAMPMQPAPVPQEFQ